MGSGSSRSSAGLPVGALARKATAAGSLATLVECVFFWPQHLELPAGSVVTLVAAAVSCFFLVGAAVSLLRSDGLLAPIWFLVPVAVGLAPFGLRRPVPALVAIAVLLVVLLWQRPRAGYPPVLAALLGSVLGNGLSWFLTFPYDGLATAPAALFILGAIALSTVIILRSSARWNDPPWRAPIQIGIAAVSFAMIAGHRARHGAGRSRLAARDTMPQLAEFARAQGVVVDRAIANAPDSLPSHASMFTGLYPVNHGAHRPVQEDDSPPPFAYPLRADVPTNRRCPRFRAVLSLRQLHGRPCPIRPTARLCRALCAAGLGAITPTASGHRRPAEGPVRAVRR